MSNVKRLSNGQKVGLAVVGVVAVVLSGLIGFVAGSDTSGSVRCEAGDVVTVDVSGADELGNGTRTVSIGDCDRISDEAFVAVVEALLRGAPTTNTTAKPPATDKPVATAPE